MNPTLRFIEERTRRIRAQGQDASLQDSGKRFLRDSIRSLYSYNFTWLGRPIIQYPQDILAMQELIWTVQPDLIVETGVAHGGTVLFHASMLQLLGGDRRLVSIDIDIRPHNRVEIEKHPLFRNVTLIEGSSVDQAVVDQVREIAKARKRVLVVLDSNHTHDHVLRELETYSPLVGKGSYLVVFDTVVEHLPPEASADRPWGPGNSPKTAVDAFLAACDRFEVDEEMDHKLVVSVAPGGYLRCVKD